MDPSVTLTVLPSSGPPPTTYTGEDFRDGRAPSGVYRGYGPGINDIFICWDAYTGYGFATSQGKISQTIIDDPKKCGCKYVRIGSLAGLAVTADPNS